MGVCGGGLRGDVGDEGKWCLGYYKEMECWWISVTGLCRHYQLSTKGIETVDCDMRHIPSVRDVYRHKVLHGLQCPNISRFIM